MQKENCMNAAKPPENLDTVEDGHDPIFFSGGFFLYSKHPSWLAPGERICSNQYFDLALIRTCATSVSAIVFAWKSPSWRWIFNFYQMKPFKDPMAKVVIIDEHETWQGMKTTYHLWLDPKIYMAHNLTSPSLLAFRTPRRLYPNLHSWD